MRHSLRYVLYRARRLGPRGIAGAAARRGRQLLGGWGTEGQAHLFGTAVTDRALARALTAESGGLAAVADGRLGPSGFFVHPGLREHLVARLRQEHPEAERAIQAAADAVMAHRFDLLGSGPTDLGACIDWQRDFKSGYRWPPRTFSRRIRYGGVPGVDVKLPWELSRFQHLPTLGKAFWLTGEARYAAEGLAQIDDWIAENPPQFGVNWACTMDVALRAFNWIWGYAFCGSAATPRFHRAFVGSLLAHGRHILSNLERGADGITSNHYLADLIGLFALGIACPFFREARAWRELALGELVREIERQVHPDGGDYESSIPYHRLVTEMFLAATILCRRHGLTLPPAYLDRLERMLEFARWYTKPNGLAPQVGDADDGRLHILANYGAWDPRDHRHLLATGGAFFRRDDFTAAAGNRGEEAVWLLPEEPPRPMSAEATAPGSRAYPESGVYLMRDGDRYCLVACGAVGTRGIGNHKHNDLLSVEFHAGGQDFLVDPGSYLYTPDPAARNLFRSTAVHNTVMVDGAEQNRFGEGSLFWLHADAVPSCLEWRPGAEEDVFVGEHTGYVRLADPVIHRRGVRLRKRDRRLEIEDRLAGEARHALLWNFTIAPGVAVRPAGEAAWELAVTGVRAVLSLDAVEPAALHAAVRREVVESWASPSYGVRRRTRALRFQVAALLPVTCRFSLQVR